MQGKLSFESWTIFEKEEDNFLHDIINGQTLPTFNFLMYKKI